MSHPESPSAVPFEPPRPAVIAGVVCVLAALVVCWPMLTGRWLLGDDQYVGGYGFRLFGAEMFRATGRIPEWNPYLFGGLPYRLDVFGWHGDCFELPRSAVRLAGSLACRSSPYATIFSGVPAGVSRLSTSAAAFDMRTQP